MKFKILINTKVIDIEMIKKLNKEYELTYADDSSVKIILDDTHIKLKDYPDYQMEYKHYLDSAESIDISFILNNFKEAYFELSSISF